MTLLKYYIKIDPQKHNDFYLFESKDVEHKSEIYWDKQKSLIWVVSVIVNASFEKRRLHYIIMTVSSSHLRAAKLVKQVQYALAVLVGDFSWKHLDQYHCITGNR